jgi:hypothetical protein
MSNENREYYRRLLEKSQSKRKCVLIAVNCAKLNWNDLPKKFKQILGMIERYFINGGANYKQLTRVKNYVRSKCQEEGLLQLYSVYNTIIALENGFFNSHDNHINVTAYTAYAIATAVDYTNWHLVEPIYKDIFTIHPKPPTNPDIINLANLIYNSQDYSIMPILGDALEELGYIGASHCREDKHYLGCSLIDLILGKS